MFVREVSITGRFLMGLLAVCTHHVNLTDAECHCNAPAACAVFPSTPCSQIGYPDRCQEGWFGSYCQKQNIALRRSSTQSSTLEPYPSYSRLAVDGVATTNALRSPRTCAHTKNETNPTWTVSLNTSVPERIQHIRLYLRDDELQERNNGMEILVGSRMCYNWSSTEHPPPIANVTCRQPLTGTTVTIRIPGPLKFLTLCEVQILVCSDGWFSERCDKQCRCLNSNEACDKTTGRCSSGCFPGYLGTDCQTACPDGTYGINCASHCGSCLNGVSCRKTNGRCPGGCAAGWMRDDTVQCLQSCPDGYYGFNCSSQCGNCLGGLHCDKRNGVCPRGCAEGWINDGTCFQRCEVGRHGINCTSDCEGEGLQTFGTYGEECSNWGIPVAVILGVLLICTVLGATIYIRRLLKQLESLKTKTREEHYVTLDERTKVPATESTYDHIDDEAP